MNRNLIVFLVACSLTLPVSAGAQPPPPEAAAKGKEPSESREALMERIRLVRMYAITEALDLDEATAAKLFPYLKDYDRKFRELHKSKREHQKALRVMVNEETYKDKKVTEHIRKLGDIEIEIAELRKEQTTGLDGILDSGQQAKFVMVQESLEHEIRKLIREHRREKRKERRGGEEGRRRPRAPR